jgi:CHAD domain-containing protein
MEGRAPQAAPPLVGLTGMPRRGATVPHEQLEIERKFDVPPSFVLPDLGTVPGVASVDGPEERSLEAVYHDAADLRLLRVPVTLRRRTGGPDAGWHVKLPAGDGARRELHFPLGRASRTPPPAVLAPVRGLVRTAAVGPVATLRTQRRVTLLRDGSGRALAEVADDSVTGSAPATAPGEPATVTTWREVEVELVDGDEQLLAAVAERLLAAGARPSSSASKLGRVLADRLAGLDGAPAQPGGAVAGPRERPGTATKGKEKKKKAGKRARAGTAEDAPRPAGPTAGAVVLAALAHQVRALQTADVLLRTGHPDGVHDLRVACRRLRSLLAAFRAVLDRAATDPLRDELRWMGAQLSGARDGEVALDHLRALVGAQPPELVLGPVAARLQQAAVAGAEADRRAADRALGDARYLALLDSLHALLARPPLTGRAQEPAGDVLADAVRRTGKRLRRRVDRAREDSTAEHLHEVRKAAKRVRYTAEVAVGVLGEPAQALVDRAEQVQEVLGERQDTVVTREQCRTLGLAAFAAGENAWTFGLLHGLERGRAERTEAAFWRLEPAVADAVRHATGKG